MNNGRKNHYIIISAKRQMRGGMGPTSVQTKRGGMGPTSISSSPTRVRVQRAEWDRLCIQPLGFVGLSFVDYSLKPAVDLKATLSVLLRVVVCVLRRRCRRRRVVFCVVAVVVACCRLALILIYDIDESISLSGQLELIGVGREPTAILGMSGNLSGPATPIRSTAFGKMCSHRVACVWW